ncbi:MAG: rod shape-determining protein MreC [Candidatus Raymondbacteria bacterium RifOxyA12_full_50_37]|uniref:Cell shape-determining protein MreC n=1 Tax=Candidatus Raymondbacteria bacterium RIFOXYD12_FULL_49_13 TaxID=1817890 RepID=A0A1F7F4E7_UNCRA|nr:MAG: rod shape-determining protein MreC [Candidatus Raymondbacteria bacterium RifOxyA12_full_50_37]OGJ86243.1 MAG: rod shape-determining protein MreC [Candidatus Raymondbacteria bacterium RIFOXYA2_FULL_49_16]OGJ95781.1 MAG: rod shape-determining protein MreC [Candidatus Raymondbacteria bacterium RIFOXYC2_FULL_50_21]OGK01458.1 MAG: rod shape-determining protein MreC [Candidatus Raymondbacteria bacterium RIFOXYD12_FULL_49_13]OGK04730.1 MAG: rod shape-determining protein MreC [Candidatus Raymon
MLSLIVHYRKFLSLVLTVLVSLWLSARDIHERYAIARGLQVTVLAPVQAVISKFSHIKNIIRMNRVLLEENARLKAENGMLNEAKRENMTLRKTVGYREQSPFILVPAPVVVQNQTAFGGNIIIAAGSLDSVKKDMPVISLQGVIGKILEVYPFTANVQLITDPFCRTGITFSRTNSPGILDCSSGAPLINTPAHSDILPGDTVVTSGMGGIYPKGLPVGVVASVRPVDNLFKTAEIRLHPGLDNIEHIFVMNIRTQWKPFEQNQVP